MVGAVSRCGSSPVDRLEKVARIIERRRAGCRSASTLAPRWPCGLADLAHAAQRLGDDRQDDAPFPNLVRLTVYTTDVDRLFEYYGVLAARSGAAGAAPATTMLGVTQLALPDLMVELEGTAVA